MEKYTKGELYFWGEGLWWGELWSFARVGMVSFFFLQITVRVTSIWTMNPRIAIYTLC